MIFTIGKKEIYEKYIDEDENAAKAAGGSVWRFWKDALAYLERTKQEGEFEVYAVDADWRDDTIDTGKEWNSLTRDAKLLRVRRS